MKKIIKMTLVFSFTFLGFLIADGHLPGENHHDGDNPGIPKDQITIENGEIILTHHKFGPNGSIEESHDIVIYLYPENPAADMQNTDEMDPQALSVHGFWQEATDNEDMQPEWSEPIEIDQFSIDEHGNLILAHDGENLIVNLMPMMHHGDGQYSDGPQDGDGQYSDGPQDGGDGQYSDGPQDGDDGQYSDGPQDGDGQYDDAPQYSDGPQDGDGQYSDGPHDNDTHGGPDNNIPQHLLAGGWWAHPVFNQDDMMMHGDGPHDEDMSPVEGIMYGIDSFIDDKIEDGDLSEEAAEYLEVIATNLEGAVDAEHDGEGDNLAGEVFQGAIEYMDEMGIDEGIKEKFMNLLGTLEWEAHNEHGPTPPPFELLDLDGDEFISQDEAKEFLGEQYSDARWAATDVNGDAIVDPDEFAVATSRPPAPNNHYDGNCAAICLGLDEYFVDANGDGWANTSGEDMDEGPFATWEEDCECPE